MRIVPSLLASPPYRRSRSPRVLVPAAVLSLAVAAPAQTAWVRVSQVGYETGSTARAFLMSITSLPGETFQVLDAAGNVALGACCALPLAARAAQPDSIATDRAHRDPSIHWPRAFDPSIAPVFSHNELLLHADCHRVWARFTNVTDWPTWFVLTRDVTLEHPGVPLARGSLIKLKIFGSPITSRIDEFVPDSRLSWIPQGADEPKPSHYHTWRFVPDASGCRVITEESGIGPNDIKRPVAISHLMHKAHELWLASLKYTSEP